MEKGNVAAVEQAVNDLGHQRTSIAVTEVVGMCAHRADFRIAGNAQPLSRHGSQLPVLLDADVSTKLDGALFEGAGLSETSQGDHFRHITRSQHRVLIL